jgi:hypothetical protein
MSDPRSRVARSLPIEPNGIACRAGVVAVQDGSEHPRLLDAHASYSAVKKRATLASGKNQSTPPVRSHVKPHVRWATAPPGRRPPHPPATAPIGARPATARCRTMPHARDRPERRPGRVVRPLAGGRRRRALPLAELGEPRLRLPRRRPEHDARRRHRGHAHRVAIGAHPSFPDLRGFGRTPMALPPHGDPRRRALPTRRPAGHLPRRGRHAAPRQAARGAVPRGVRGPGRGVGRRRGRRGVRPGLPWSCRPTRAPIGVLEDAGLLLLPEAFLDRGYQPDGRLVPRHRPAPSSTTSTRSSNGPSRWPSTGW